MIDDIVDVLEACFEKHCSMELHRLLYAVEARQRAIPRPEEINTALERVSAGVDRGDDVPHVSLEAPGDRVELLDFAKALLAYRRTWGRKPVFRSPGKSID